MKISRRNLLRGTSVLALSIVLSKQAESGLIHRSSALTSFNGGVTQANPATTGNLFFINMFKSSGVIGYNNAPTGPSVPSVPISELDANGYPTSIAAGTGGWHAVFPLEAPANYSGQWIVQWDGIGTCSLGNFQFTIITSTSNSIIFTSQQQAGFHPTFFCTATNAAPNNVRNIRITRYQNAVPDDATLLASGAIFFPDFLNLYKSAKFGSMRSLTLGSAANGVNTSTLATWAQRRSLTWATYGDQQYRADWYGGFTTNNGSDYSLTFPGWTLTDKNIVQLVFNATAPQIGRTSISWSTTNTVAININWPAHGLSVGNTVCFGNTGQPPSALTPAQTYFINNVIDANNFTVSATSGGSSVVATATTSGTMFVVSLPRLNINGTGFFPTASQQLPQPLNVFSTGKPTNASNAITTLTYDVTTQAYWMPQDAATGGMLNQIPPETWVDFCAQVGSHPWLVTPFLAAEDVAGGFSLMVNWANYATSTYPWMKPLIEPPNETWGAGRSGFTASTAFAPAVAWALWQSTDLNEAYGRWVSRIGQAISTLYGNDRTKYSMVCAVQTTPLNGQIIVQNNPRLFSNLDSVLAGGSHAYLWTDRVCGANYITPTRDFHAQLLIDAFNYSVTNAGNPTAQAVIANAYASTTNDGTNQQYSITYVVNGVGSGGACFVNLKAWAQGMPGGNTIKGMVGYEGGWAPQYGNPQSVFFVGRGSTAITGATAANPCVVTLSTTTVLPYQNSIVGDTPPNPAVVGWAISPTNIVGMTQLNCPLLAGASLSGSTVTVANSLLVNQAVTFVDDGGVPAALNVQTIYYVVNPTGANFQIALTRGGSPIAVGTGSNIRIQPGWFITGVGGGLGANAISLDVDSSAFTPYVSGGSAFWMNCGYYENNLTYAGGNSAAAGTVNAAMYAAFFGLASAGFVCEFPSNFIPTGTALPWTVLYPDIYALLTPQWNSIVAAN